MIPYNLKAIKIGISLARKYDAKLLVLHLISNPVDMMALNAPGQPPGEQYKNPMNSHQEAQERLGKFIEQEMRSGFPRIATPCFPGAAERPPPLLANGRLREAVYPILTSRPKPNLPTKLSLCLLMNIPFEIAPCPHPAAG